jgi:hypothetical protein
VQFVAQLAPVVDRVFSAGMLADRECGGRELVVRHGGPERVGLLIEFRTALAWPGREVSWAGLAAVTRYRPPAKPWVVDRAALGAYSISATGFRSTDSGHTFLIDLCEHQAETLSRFWSRALLEPALSLLGRVLHAAGATGGDAFAAMAPPFEPPDEPAPLKLLNRLGTLRYHRADAHADAWTAAGHTAASVVALPPGPDRDAIEAQTNINAAPPFEVLTPAERAELLHALSALPD